MNITFLAPCLAATTLSLAPAAEDQGILKKGDVVFKANFGNPTERDKWSRAAFAK